MIVYFINLLIITIIKLKISFITRSLNFSSLIIKSIITSFYNINIFSNVFLNIRI